jgi:hypothetical protein
MCLSMAFAGCATESTILMVSRTGHQVVKGTANWLEQRANISLNGHVYRGNYILTPSPQTTIIINNNEGEKKDGHQPASSAPRSLNGTGKMLLLSDEGDALRCEFSYEESLGIKAIGICTDASQREFDLQIDTSF